jgi:hypothetical protein
MTASQALNNVRLPRAVLRKSAEIETHLAAQREAHARLSEQPPAAPALQAPADPPNGTPAAPATDPRESDPAYWKHRYQTTEGVLRAERDAQRQRLAAETQRITDLQEQVRTLQAAVPEPAPDITKAFSPEDIEKYGADQCAAMLRVADAQARDRVAKAVETQIKPIQDEAKAAREAQAAQAARDEQAKMQLFLDSLEDAHPGFLALDKTDAWRAWLAETDPATDTERQLLLNEYVRRKNVAAIVRLAKVFEQLTRTPTPPATPHGTAGNGGSEPPPPSQAAQLGAPTDAQVNDFFKRAALGKVRPEERTQFEARMKLRVPHR